MTSNDASGDRPLPALYHEQPASLYTDPARYDTELAAVFTRHWLLAAPLAAVPDTGAVAVTVAGRDLVVTHDGTAVRAFHNVCSHRGSAVVEGRCEGTRLQCGYHGWTYDLGGRVVAVPGRRRFGDGLDLEACGLPAVAAQRWGGFVWVHLGPADAPVESWLEGWAGELARYRTDDQRVFASRVDQVRLNWKATVDAFNETYHVSFIHPDSVGRYVQGNASWFRYDGPHSRMVIPVRQTLAEAQGRSRDGRSAPATDKDLLPEQAHDHCNYTIFPNVILNLLPTWGIVLQFEPLAVDRTEIRTWMLADQPASDRQELAFDAQWNEFTKTLDQDIHSIEAIGRGMRSPAFTTVRFGGAEERLVHFHGVVDDTLQPAESGDG